MKPAPLVVALAALLIFVLGAGVYAQTLDSQFVWDDSGYLTQYLSVISSLSADNLGWMLVAREMANWHPLTWLSWAVDYQLYGGLDARGYHLTNNLLHAANSVLVMLVARQFLRLLDFPAQGARPETSITLAAACAGVLFAVHPQHVEVVAWVSQRKELLCLFFLLIATSLYVRFATGDRRIVHLHLAALAYLFAAMSKPMAVTFPFALLLLDVYPLRRTRLLKGDAHPGRVERISRLLLEKRYFFLVSAFLVIITLTAQQEAMRSLPLLGRLVNACVASVSYLLHLFWPLDLSPFYPHSLVRPSSFTWTHGVCVGLVLGISAVSLVAWRKGHRGWLIAWLFYLLTLSPTLGIVQVGVQGMAERYAYLPTLPAYIMAGALVLAVLVSGRRMLIGGALAAVMALASALSVLTWQQSGTWQSSRALWGKAYSYFPDNHYINWQMGIVELNQGNAEQAARFFEAMGALEKPPADSLAWRGVAYMRLGRHAEAIDVLVALGLAAETPGGPAVDEPCLQYDIGWNFAQLGMWPEARELFGRIDPGSPIAGNAARWLEWIEHASPAPGQDEAARPGMSELPEFCQRPLESMR